jgi:hypothetical protein
MAETMLVGANWECPYCQRAQTITESRFFNEHRPISNDASILGTTAVSFTSVVCANNECRRMSLTMALSWRKPYEQYPDHYELGKQIQVWNLLPESNARVLPPYIPRPINDDYLEACRIRDLSPKASATLARRALQGMIRDFCGITRPRLVDEISVLRADVAAGKAPQGVHADTVDAIDHVRSIGNIGAHMEKDINVIVDVDPDEAQTLVGLLELLFDEWYIARQERTDRLAKIGIVAANKAAAKLATPVKQLPP